MLAAAGQVRPPNSTTRACPAPQAGIQLAARPTWPCTRKIKAHTAFIDQVRQRMQHWQQDTDFAGIRDAALAKLLRMSRRSQWADVAALLKKAAEQPEPASPPVEKK